MAGTQFKSFLFVHCYLTSARSLELDPFREAYVRKVNIWSIFEDRQKNEQREVGMGSP